MTLRLPTYVRREEPLRGQVFRVWSIFATGVRRGFRRILVVLVLLVALAWGVISTILFIFLSDLVFDQTGQPVTLFNFFVTIANPIMLIFILLVAAVVGAGLIADDLRHRSLTLYLSRPVTTLGYLVAKVSVVGLALFIAIAFPGILSPIVAALLLYVSWETALAALGAGLAFGLLALAVFSLLALMFSSLTDRKGIAAAATFGVGFGSSTLAMPLQDLFKADEFLHISLYENLLAVARPLYAVEQVGIAWDVALAILIGVMAVAGAVTFLRMRTIEVVSG